MGEDSRKTSTDKEDIIANLDTKYKEVKIDKMVVNGKEQQGSIISADDTKGKNELNVKVYTQDITTIPKKRKVSNTIYELLQKSIFRNKRS